MPMDSIMSSLRIVALEGVMDREALEERLMPFEELKDDRLGLMKRSNRVILGSKNS